MTFRSNECIRDFHEDCESCQCECHEKKYLTKEEIKTLYEWLKYEFTPHENEPLYEVFNKITKIAMEDK